jgi:hypothetical protein
VEVMNTMAEAIVIPVGTKYGRFSRIIDIAQHSEHPFCVGVIKETNGLHHLDQDEHNGPGKKKKMTAKKKTAQETVSADQTGPELAPWLVGPTTVRNTAARMAHLISVFKLKDSPLLQTETKLMQAAYMLLKRWACFSFNVNYVGTTLLKHSIVTDPDQHPINQQFWPVNPHLAVDLKKQIDKRLKHGVIKKSCSPLNFGLVAAPKKGGAIHWCIDYRSLNDISSISSSPISNTEDNLARLSSLPFSLVLIQLGHSMSLN